MSEPALLTLLDEVRGRTLRLLDGVDEAHARWAPPGLQNHILWHAGHCWVLQEWLVAGAVDRGPHDPAGWFELFGWHSRPAQVPAARWPSLADIAAALEVQYGRQRELIAALSEAQLSARPGPAAGWQDRTVRFCIVHALHDEALHGGEMALLRKLQGLWR